MHHFLLLTIIGCFMAFPLADKSINYLGVGVCGLSLFLFSHTIFLINFKGLFSLFISSTEILWTLGLGEEPNPDSL